MAEYNLAAYMNTYTMRDQHTPDRALTRYKHDLGKMVENNEISTGPGRWALGVPNAYGNAAYVPDVTTINQRWGASHIMTSTKTDVESDLKNLGRPTVRTSCGQYQPQHGLALAKQLTPMPEASFPQVASHLIDPPCTLRGTGINRWQWLCENPQENVSVPFEHLIDSRHASKDAVYHKMSKPLETPHASCGTFYLDPAVPVERQRRPTDPPIFMDTIPGQSQKMSLPPPPAHTQTNQAPLVAGMSYAPPRLDQTGRPEVHMRDRVAPPAPFTSFIAPH